MQFKVIVPATTANIGPGFDVWGMALKLFNTFEVSTKRPQKDSFQISNEFGPLAKKTYDVKKAAIGTDSSNLLYRCYHYLFEKSGLEEIPIHVKAKIDIPIARGLGSSSTVIVAGLMIANHVLRRHYGFCYSIDEIFQYACQLEGHPDNIAPAMFGGLVAAVKNPHYRVYEYAKLSFVSPLKIAGVVPHISLSTELARKAVLRDINLEHLIFHQGRMALLTHLFAKKSWQPQDYQLLETALEDLIHQRQRAKHIDGMAETFVYWKEQGALGSFLSGAGSTLLAFWKPNTDIKSLALNQMFIDKRTGAEVVEFEYNNEGCYVEG